MSKKLTRVLAAALLLATFTAAGAQASPWSLGGGEPSPAAALWEWLASWFRPAEPSAVWTEGCGMDPNGGCHNGATTPDEGSQMDPDGATTGDEGCGMDPNGC
jgi:hypothetical protein